MASDPWGQMSSVFAIDRMDVLSLVVVCCDSIQVDDLNGDRLYKILDLSTKANSQELTRVR